MSACSGKHANLLHSWINFSWQDETWAEFTTLEVAIYMLYNFVLSVKLPNLKLKTRPRQLLGFVPLVIALPAALIIHMVDTSFALKYKTSVEIHKHTYLFNYFMIYRVGYSLSCKY
jgi:hypothetical protein